MCIAKPGLVVSISGESAVVSFGEVKTEVLTQLAPTVKVGDYVLVHAGFVIEILDKNDALETLKCFKAVEN